jgi:adenosylcobinamide-GDP ribazoletransferase
MRGLITAIRTLTILRVPGKDSDNLANSLPWFPVVGILIGTLVALVASLVGQRLHWPMGAAVLCVAVSAILTGGLHLDGLGDAFDSFGGHTREKKLEIMKDPRIGSFGVMAICIVVLMKFAALTLVAGVLYPGLIIIPFILSRTAQVGLIAALPYARSEGGTGRRFVEGADVNHAAIAALIGIGASVLISPSYGLILTLVAGLAVLLLWLWMRHAFAGITGDLIGMGSEIVETALFMTLAVSNAGHFTFVENILRIHHT